MNVLNYHGAVPFTGAFSPVSNDYGPLIAGKYGLWVYEHLLNRTTASGNVAAFRNALVTAIQTELLTSPTSISLNRLRVERSADGAPVTPIE